jgi:ribonuclease III
MSAELAALEKRLEHVFADTRLLQRALTHRSFSSEHYERLEFLGDSVLNLAISSLLYDKLGGLPEGDLSRIRANLVKQDTLHEIALQIGLPGLLRLGEGEAKSGGHKRPSILADALEAIMGAVYVDAGFLAARSLVYRLFENVEINPNMHAMGKDAKTALQEWLQGRKKKLPQYDVVHIGGAAHKQTFEVKCSLEDPALHSLGEGTSRRTAEQAAATAMLEKLKAFS